MAAALLKLFEIYFCFLDFWKSNLIRKSIIKIIRFEVYLSVQLKWFLSKFLKTSTNFSRTLRINCKSMTCNIRKFIENFQQLLTICNHFADSLLLIFVLTFPSNSLIYQRMNSFFLLKVTYSYFYSYLLSLENEKV